MYNLYISWKVFVFILCKNITENTKHTLKMTFPYTLTSRKCTFWYEDRQELHFKSTLQQIYPRYLFISRTQHKTTTTNKV